MRDRQKAFLLGMISFVWVVLFAGIGLGSEQVTEEYTVDTNDTLKIVVYGHNDMSTIPVVRGDGTIVFPFIDSVAVKGLTTRQIAEKIAAALADGYIVDPKVNVSVEKLRPQNVYISGEVGKPGAYQYELGMTVIEGITLAGGFKEKSSKEEIKITRKDSNGEKQTQEKVAIDTVIKPGDVIFVPERFLQDIFVTGQVKNPNAYRFEEGITLIKAITLAGGFTRLADKDKVKITRKVAGKEELLENFKMDDPLKAGDVIVVPESFF